MFWEKFCEIFFWPFSVVFVGMIFTVVFRAVVLSWMKQVRKGRKAVREASPMLAELAALNEVFAPRFHNLSPVICCAEEVSPETMEYKSIDGFARERIEASPEYFARLVGWAKEDKQIEREYIAELSRVSDQLANANIVAEGGFDLDIEAFRACEAALFRESKLRPVVTPIFEFAMFTKKWRESGCKEDDGIKKTSLSVSDVLFMLDKIEE